MKAAARHQSFQTPAPHQTCVPSPRKLPACRATAPLGRTKPRNGRAMTWRRQPGPGQIAGQGQAATNTDLPSPSKFEEPACHCHCHCLPVQVQKKLQKKTFLDRDMTPRTQDSKTRTWGPN